VAVRRHGGDRASGGAGGELAEKEGEGQVRGRKERGSAK